jgi:hypothetical protein
MDSKHRLDVLLNKRLVFAAAFLLGATIVNAVGYYADRDNLSHFVLALLLFFVSLRFIPKSSKGEAKAICETREGINCGGVWTWPTI